MQLDQARLQIRPRNYLDILDFTIVVLRKHWLVLTLSAAVGVAPAILLNTYLIGQQEGAEAFFAYTYLMVIEAPFVLAGLTLVLGQVTFEPEVSFRRLLKDVRRSLVQLFVYQTLYRTLLYILFLVPLIVVPLRRKFTNEIILLEQNGIRKTARRLASFHNVHSDRTASSAIVSGIFGVFMAVCLCHGLSSLANMLSYQPKVEWTFEESEFGDELATLMYQAFPIYDWEAQVAVWLTLAFLTVARFLLYLDCRMRAEGWDIELKLRAAGERIKQDVW